MVDSSPLSDLLTTDGAARITQRLIAMKIIPSDASYKTFTQIGGLWSPYTVFARAGYDREAARALCDPIAALKLKAERDAAIAKLDAGLHGAAHTLVGNMRGGAGSAHKGRSEADKARVQAVTDEQGHVSYEALTRPPSGDMTVIPRLYSALFDNPDYNAGQLPTVKLARSSSFQHTNGHLLQGGNAAMILALRAADEHTPAADIMASWPKPQPKIAPLEPTLVVPLMSVGGQITVRCRSKCHHLGRVPGLTAAVSGLCFAFQRTPPPRRRHRPFWMHRCFQKPCASSSLCANTNCSF
jgi:hypothetical protein